MLLSLVHTATAARVEEIAGESLLIGSSAALVLVQTIEAAATRAGRVVTGDPKPFVLQADGGEPTLVAELPDGGAHGASAGTVSSVTLRLDSVNGTIRSVSQPRALSKAMNNTAATWQIHRATALELPVCRRPPRSTSANACARAVGAWLPRHRSHRYPRLRCG